MDTRPWKDVIEKEIATLKSLKPRVRETSAFGDNHRDAIEAQIDVLENRLSDNQIYDGYGEDNTAGRDFAENVLDEALNARRWLDGEEDNPPSVGWAELAQ